MELFKVQTLEKYERKQHSNGESATRDSYYIELN